MKDLTTASVAQEVTTEVREAMISKPVVDRSWILEVEGRLRAEQADRGACPADRLSAMPSLLLLLPLNTDEGPGLTPYVIGIGTLLLLFALMATLLAFGKGREHS